MKSKPQHLVKRILVLLLTLSILWSDASFVSLAQTIGEQTVDLQGEAPSAEPEEEAIQESSTEPAKEPVESADPTQEPAEPAQEPVEPTQEPIEPTQEPTEEPSAEPVETPESTEMPEGEETPMPSETPSMTPGQEKLALDTATEEEDDGRFSFRIGDADENWNPDTGAKITAESVIKIYDNTAEKYLANDDVKEITWFAKWIDQEGAEPYEIGKGITELDLSQQFFPFAFQVSVEFTLKDGDKRSMWLGNVEPSETQEAPEDALQGLPMPGCTLFLNAEDVMEGNCFFIRAEDVLGTNSVCVGGGGTSYEIQNDDNGKYIYVKYAVRNSQGKKSNFRTGAVRVGYSTETTPEAKAANAELLQKHIDKLAEIAQEYGQQELRIPAGVQIAAAKPITLYDGITLVSDAGIPSEENEVPAPTFTGSIVIKKYNEDKNPIGRARIQELWIDNTAGGTVIDASADVCVVLENCQFDINKSATFLKVSKDSYARTELNYSRVKFNDGGTLLELTDASSMPSVFRLGNAELSVKVVKADVTMLGASGGVKWNVDNLSPMDSASVKLLSAGNNVINNVFGIEGVDGMLSNSKELNVDSVHDKWISPVLADGSHFSSEGARIIVWAQDGSEEQYTEQYTVMAIPEECNWGFRPYAVTETYEAGKGSYSKLLPAGYLAYVVIDVNQKDGFPYGAVVGKEINITTDDFVVMQYHQDKSVEMVASVEGGEVVTSKKDSGFAGLNKTDDGKYQILAHTRVDGDDVQEPVVLAVYAGVPGAQTKLSVYEEEQVYDEENDQETTKEVLSDGKILTDSEKKVYLKINDGITANANKQDAAFEVIKSGCTVPEGAITSEVSGNGAELTLTIPEGTYGALTVKAHYKAKGATTSTDISYTLQLTSIGEVEGVTVDSVNSGKKYYGTATFKVLSSEAKPFLSVKAENGDGDDIRYNLKVVSSALSGNTVTVQYVLDLRDEGVRNDEGARVEPGAWETMVNHPPVFLVETVAGTWAIPFETSGEQLSYEAGGVRCLFDIEGNTAVYTGAIIIDSNEYYEGGQRLEIPSKVTVDGTEYTVTAMAAGCLNNIYQNGVRREAPEVVIIPATVTDIRGLLVTDKSNSNLRQIVVEDGNTVYCSCGSREDFDTNERDDAKYCALYKKNGSATELIEIASNYEGDLVWRKDAQWTDDTYDLDFSNIAHFWMEDDSSEYWDYDGILIQNIEGGAAVIKVPGKWGTTVMLPEGITTVKARALEGVAISTLVLPSTMEQWEEGAVTQAKNIYVYNKDINVNPVSGMADSVKGVTFYGFTDAKGNSALKTWVTAQKGQGHKFVAMKENNSAADYTITTLQEAVKSSTGIEYYQVNLGTELTEYFNFDIVSKVTNGYPGKTDVYAHIEGYQEEEDVEANAEEDSETPYLKVKNEFAKVRWDDGTEHYRAENPGVAKVIFEKDGTVIKEVYFVVRPGWFAVNGPEDDPEGGYKIPFGETGKITAEIWQWDDNVEKENGEKGDNVPYNLSEDALQEYEALGVLRVVTPDERNVDGGDAWEIVRYTQKQGSSSQIVYEVTPLLGKDSKGNIKGGGEGSEFILEMFGDCNNRWVETMTDGEGGLTLNDGEWNPLMIKEEEKEIPIMLQKGEGDPEEVDYFTTFSANVPQVACEVISGNKVVDAAIENKDGKAVLKLAAKAEGKAQVRVYTPYAYNGDMVLTVSVGQDLVGSFELTLGKSETEEGIILGSTVDPNDVSYERVFDIGEKDDNDNLIWENVIHVSDINNTTELKTDDEGQEFYPELSSAKLTWTVSDTALAALVKDKDKVTGIQLKGEGTVLVTATVKDTNAAAIRMLFTVKDVKPRLHNDSASLDLYKVDSAAEYTFAVPEGVTIKGDSLAIDSAILNKKDDGKDNFEVKLTGEDKVSVSIKEGKTPAAGKYTLTFKAGITYANGEEDEVPQDMGPYPYTVTLQLGGSVPKATVTAGDAIDLAIPSKRESALTVKLGDTVNSTGTTITLDTTDAVTRNFSTYFALKGDNGEYKVRFKDANGKTSAEIVKLFNGKKIKLNVTSTDYSDYTKKAEVSFKISATTPTLKAAGNGKVTVNTTDVTTYRANDAAIGLTDGAEAYTASMSYTLTDGFILLNGSEGDNSESGSIDMVPVKHNAQITFWQEGEEIIAMAAPGVPKGTYAFTWTPKVKAVGDDIYTEGQSLKAQTVSVVVMTSSAKATLSSAKLTVDKNYIYSEKETQIQFDESQIPALYGYDRWMTDYDAERTKASIKLEKAPKGANDNEPAFEVDNDRIRVSVSEDVTVGEYKYSITPYVIIRRNNETTNWENEDTPMALAPITLTVQVTETLPTASLAQTTVTLDNNDLSAMALIKWDIKGDYQWIAGPWDEDEDEENGDAYERHPEYIASYENGPVVYLEGNEIRVQVTNDTLKGTYKIPVTPKVVLDSVYDEETDKTTDKNIQPLNSVTLTVKVNSTRPTLKLGKSALTAYSSYPGGEDGEEYYVPAEANTEISASNGYGIGALEIVPADTNTETVQDKITLSPRANTDEEGNVNIYGFDIIPATDTKNGTYNYLLYSWLDDKNEEEHKGKALEPVKLKVTISDSKPKLQLSASSILLPAGRHGSTVITLQGQTDSVKSVAAKIEYLVPDGKGWKLETADTEPDGAYATLETLEDGTVTITSSENAEAVNKAVVSYKQEVTLKGNNTPYEASYNLTFNLKTAEPKAVLSTKTVTVNKNYSEWDQNNCVTLTLDNGEKIVGCDIDNTSGAIGIREEESNEYATVYRVFFTKPNQEVKKGKYKIKLTPYVGAQKKLSPVELTVDVTDTLPTVSASQTKVTINKLDQRENTYQSICLKPSLPYADVDYDISVTKGPKGVNLSGIDFVVNRGDNWDSRETNLVLGSTDRKIPDGSYTVTVTPYTMKSNGERTNLKSINITVTLNSPKITAAVQAPKVTIDLATANSMEVRNSILLTGTNAEEVSKIYWNCELTKKPKGAGDEIRIEDLWSDEVTERNGKDFTICWGDRQAQGERYINVTLGTYEFTLTPTGLEFYDGRVNAPTPSAIKLTVTVKNSMPTVKYGKTSSKMNMAFVNEDSLFTTLSDASWHLQDVDAVMTSWPKGAGEEKSALRIDYDGNNRLRISGSDKVPEGTYTFQLEPQAEKNGIVLPLKEQKYTVTVKNEIPTAKASSSKLTCNVLYTENYWIWDEEGELSDNFSKKQQTKLTLSKNYGPSYFEDVKFTFTGKAAQQTEADKINLEYVGDETIVASLQQGRVAATGSYTFEATPIIRGSDTGTKMILKPVKLTVVVENKVVKASAKASGKIDLLNREGSGITYKVTLSDNDADSVDSISLTGPEKGNDESWRFEVIQDKEKDPAECIVRAQNGAELSTKVNYEMRLEVHTRFGKTYYVPVKIKPTQSTLTAKADVTAVSLFKQASEGTAAVTEIKATINNTPAGEMQILTEEREDGRELLTGNADFRVLVIEPETPPAEEEDEEALSAAEEPKSVTVKVLFASEQAKGKYKAGSKVTLPIYVNVHNQATDTYNTVKVNLTVNIKN